MRPLDRPDQCFTTGVPTSFKTARSGTSSGTALLRLKLVSAYVSPSLTNPAVEAPIVREVVLRPEGLTHGSTLD